MNIFKFELKRNFKGLILWSLVCSGLIVLFMAMFPSMKDMGMQELVGSKLEALPSGFLEAFNINGMMDFSNIKDYMAYCLQYIGMAAGIYGAILGVSALSKEENEGTIEFLYSKPITRMQIVTSKLLVAIVVIYIFILLVGGTTMSVALMVKPEDIKYLEVLMDIKTIYIGISLLSYIFMAIGFLISVCIKKRVNETAVALGVYFISFFLGIIGKLKEELNWLIYFSPTDYFTPTRLFQDGFKIEYIITTLLVILFSILLTYKIYNKKDLG